jgi:hypothetical protein
MEIKRIYAIAIFMLAMPLIVDGVAQIYRPQTPSFNERGQVPINQHYINKDNLQQNQSDSHSTYPMGATAQDIIEKQYQHTEQQMGASIYRPYLTPEQNRQRQTKYIQRQIQNSSYSSKNQSKNDKIIDILNEIHEAENSQQVRFDYYASPEFVNKTKFYTDALQHLKEQLSGKRQLSLSDAFFEVENAYGNPYLSKKEYDKQFKESVDFIKKWMKQNGYNSKSNADLHLAIQQFMGDTLVIRENIKDDAWMTAKKITHYPFFYDYDDYTYEKDFRNQFVTKTVATGSGQCHSLPALYSALAQQLGAKSYISFAPNHDFVKYPDNTGKIHNYEPTSNWKISDKWYQDHLFIGAEAKRNKIYLDTLNTKQVVANCAIELAISYMKKYGIADARFVDECLETAIPYFPNGNNIYIHLVISSKLARMLDRELRKSGITDLNNIRKSPSAHILYNALQKNEEHIRQLGYQEIPDQLYDQLMKQHEFKGRIQILDGKQKRNLFLESY